MKGFVAIVFCCAVAVLQPVNADTVVDRVPDTIGGKGIGGMTGFLLGGAAGGPLGALGAGLVSIFIGSEVQEATGLHGDAYVVESDAGERQTVRSPNLPFDVGDKVVVTGNRLAPY